MTMFREFIRSVIAEGFGDIVTIGIKIRIRTSKSTDPAVIDILTGIRGVEHVVTVKQTGEMSRSQQRQFINVIVNFEKSKNINVEDIARAIKKIDGVDIVKVVSYEGRPYFVNGKALIV